MHFPLSYEAAGYWADVLKKWPGIFHSALFRKQVTLSRGMRMELGFIDVIERSLLTRGEWDAPVAGALARVLKPGDTFLDIGANIGYFALLGSAIVGAEGRVIAFEPSLRALERLTRNLTLNNTKNVRLVSAAAGPAYGTAQLNLATPNNIGGSSLREVDTAVDQETIFLVDLAHWLEAMKIIPDVIKLDVEGFEHIVLQSMTDALRQNRPIVICEVTEDFLNKMGSSAYALVEYMSEHGYTAYYLTDDGSRNFVSIDMSRMFPQQCDCIFLPSETRLERYQ